MGIWCCWSVSESTAAAAACTVCYQHVDILESQELSQNQQKCCQALSGPRQWKPQKVSARRRNFMLISLSFVGVCVNTRMDLCMHVCGGVKVVARNCTTSVAQSRHSTVLICDQHENQQSLVLYYTLTISISPLPIHARCLHIRIHTETMPVHPTTPVTRHGADAIG